MDDRECSGQPGKKLFVDARLSLPSNVCASCKMALFSLTHGDHGYLETPPPFRCSHYTFNRFGLRS